MARVTQSQVLAIMTFDTKAYPDMTPFIAAASALVDVYCVEYSSTYDLPAYSDEQLAQIELWLSAHVATAADSRSRSESAGSVAESYSLTTDLFLNNSHYGQMAIMLDSNGGLARAVQAAKTGKVSPLGSRVIVGVHHV